MQSQPRNPAEMYEQYFVPAMFLPWAASCYATLRSK